MTYWQRYDKFLDLDIESGKQKAVSPNMDAAFASMKQSHDSPCKDLLTLDLKYYEKLDANIRVL